MNFPLLALSLRDGLNECLLQLWLEARWTLLRETSARTGKSPPGLLFLVKRLVGPKHRGGFTQSVGRKANDSTAFPVKVINYSWPFN